MILQGLEAPVPRGYGQAPGRAGGHKRIAAGDKEPENDVDSSVLLIIIYAGLALCAVTFAAAYLDRKKGKLISAAEK
jgi:hypothetical protein